MPTFNNGEKVVPALVASEPDEEGVVTVFAAEGDSSAVKAFAAKKNPDGDPDYVRP